MTPPVRVAASLLLTCLIAALALQPTDACGRGRGGGAMRARGRAARANRLTSKVAAQTGIASAPISSEPAANNAQPANQQQPWPQKIINNVHLNARELADAGKAKARHSLGFDQADDDELLEELIRRRQHRHLQSSQSAPGHSQHNSNLRPAGSYVLPHYQQDPYEDPYQQPLPRYYGNQPLSRLDDEFYDDPEYLYDEDPYEQYDEYAPADPSYTYQSNRSPATNLMSPQNQQQVTANFQEDESYQIRPPVNPPPQQPRNRMPRGRRGNGRGFRRGRRN